MQEEVLVTGFPKTAAICGWISVAAWVIVYTPQLWLCVVQQSGEGLSLVFLFIWLAGDLNNLIGAMWQGLLPTMIILAVYYTLCDIVLIFQVFYYRRKRILLGEDIEEPAVLDEHTLLLSGLSNISNRGITPSSGITEKHTKIAYSLGLIVLVSITVFGVVSTLVRPPSPPHETWNTSAQVFGWISAFLYLGSRLPQIHKNTQTKCEGLSLVMFAFTVLGNTTYVLSIILQSFDGNHIIVNLAWLVGSGGTILLDFIVLGQFYYYQSERQQIFVDSTVEQDIEEEDA